LEAFDFQFFVALPNKVQILAFIDNYIC